MPFLGYIHKYRDKYRVKIILSCYTHYDILINRYLHCCVIVEMLLLSSEISIIRSKMYNSLSFYPVATFRVSKKPVHRFIIAVTVRMYAQHTKTSKKFTIIEGK